MTCACACLGWKICCLCQQNNNKPVICPAKNPIKKLREKGYETLAANLEQIRQFTYKLPSGFAIDALDNGTGIAATLIKEKTLWHKACSLKYTNSKRLQSLIESLETPLVSTSVEVEVVDEKETCKRTFTRSTTVAVDPKKNICFICRSPNYQQKFVEKCQAVKDSFLQYENPFLSKENGVLLTLDTRVVAGPTSVKVLYDAEKTGQQMYHDFIQDRLCLKNKSVYEPQ
ncbi:hypothetical protein FQR65_LT12721 [Abscondita terminalis]|nr:hypothetical protein FQR65_LT12721 [Abscondita terminalis]